MECLDSFGVCIFVIRSSFCFLIYFYHKDTDISLDSEIYPYRIHPSFLHCCKHAKESKCMCHTGKLVSRHIQQKCNSSAWVSKGHNIIEIHHNLQQVQSKSDFHPVSSAVPKP